MTVEIDALSYKITNDHCYLRRASAQENESLAMLSLAWKDMGR